MPKRVKNFDSYVICPEDQEYRHKMFEMLGEPVNIDNIQARIQWRDAFDSLLLDIGCTE